MLDDLGTSEVVNTVNTVCEAYAGERAAAVPHVPMGAPACPVTSSASRCVHTSRCADQLPELAVPLVTKLDQLWRAILDDEVDETGLLSDNNIMAGALLPATVVHCLMAPRWSLPHSIFVGAHAHARSIPAGEALLVAMKTVVNELFHQKKEEVLHSLLPTLLALADTLFTPKGPQLEFCDEGFDILGDIIMVCGDRVAEADAVWALYPKMLAFFKEGAGESVALVGAAALDVAASA